VYPIRYVTGVKVYSMVYRSYLHIPVLWTCLGYMSILSSYMGTSRPRRPGRANQGGLRTKKGPILADERSI